MFLLQIRTVSLSMRAGIWGTTPPAYLAILDAAHPELSAYQINFMANWISLGSVVVWLNKPALPFTVPSPFNMFVLPSPKLGTLKLAWFRILKNSARNCTLKLSEILLMELFLTTEKSRFIKPGPINVLRPTLPRRLKHLRSPAGSGLPTVGGAGSQLAVQKAWLGAIGTVKQLEVGLMYSGFVLSFRKFRSIGLHPGTALG